MKTLGGRAMAFLFLVAAAGSLAAGPLGADPKTLKLQDAVRLATEHNLSLQRTSWDLDAKKRQADKAWNVFVPSASISTTLARSNPSASYLTGTVIDSTVTTSAALNLSLNISGNILASLEALELNYHTGLVTYELAKRSLEKSVRLAYYSLLLEKENLKLTQDSIDRATKNLAKVQANYRAGLVPDLDVLSAQVALEQLKPQYQQLETIHINDLGQLKFLLGIPQDQDIALEGSLSTALEKSLNLAAVQVEGTVSPDVQKAQLSVDSSELNKRALDLNSWFPTLSLGWGTSPTLPDALGKGKYWQDNGSLSVRLSYSLDSLIPFTQSRESILQAEDTLRKARSQLEETKTSSALTRANTIRTIQQAVQSLASLELNVQLAQKTYDLNVDSYNKGGKDLLAVQSSEGDLNSARYKVLSQRYTLISNVLAMEYELGVPFGTLTGELP